MLNMLSEKEKAVVDTITMRFHGAEAFAYLKDLGMEMGLSTYYRYRRKVEDMKLERMQFIADHFQELHLEKIDRLELIDRLMWQEYEKETQPYRRVKILETIANAQANVSSYYETSTIALEVSAKFNGHANNKKNDCSPMSFEDWTKNNIQHGLATIPITARVKTVNITGDCKRNTGRILRTGRIKTSVLILMMSGLVNQIHQKQLKECRTIVQIPLLKLGINNSL